MDWCNFIEEAHSLTGKDLISKQQLEAITEDIVRLQQVKLIDPQSRCCFLEKMKSLQSRGLVSNRTYDLGVYMIHYAVFTQLLLKMGRESQTHQ